VQVENTCIIARLKNEGETRKTNKSKDYVLRKLTAYFAPMSKGIYNFPVSKTLEAIRVTDPIYNADLFKDELYVNLDSVRGTETLGRIKANLGVTKNKLTLSSDYVKIVFSGHRGCGKTSELIRLHTDLNHPHLYSSIFISIEEETELQRFQPEDLYLLLLLKLIEFIDNNDIKVNKAGLKLLSEELFRSEEVKEQLKSYAKGN